MAENPLAELRDAARDMRSEKDRPEFWAALADLLEAHADQAEQSGLWLPHALSPGPLAVARAYLRGAADV